MRIVLDTNVIISGLLVPSGVCGRILRLFEDPTLILLSSQDLLDELEQKLVAKLGYSPADARKVRNEFQNLAEVIRPVTYLEIVLTDPTDDRVLECAVDGSADVVVTGDKAHLLPLRQIRKIPIVNPRNFLDQITSPAEG